MEEDYRKLIGNSRSSLEENPKVTYMKQLSKNLQKFKKVTKPWARVYLANRQKQLKEVESSLKDIYEQNNTGVFTKIEL